MSLIPSAKRPRLDESISLTSGVLLEQHSGPVFCSRFSSDGRFIASGGMDRTCVLWNIPEPDVPPSFAVLRHKHAVTSLRWASHNEQVITACADRTVGLWDVESEKKVRRFTGHLLVVNEVETRKDLKDGFISVLDDGNMFVWDPRAKDHVLAVKTEYPLMCLSTDDNLAFILGVNPVISAFDIRKGNVPVYEIETLHEDLITSLLVDGDVLVSGSMDGTVRAYNSSIHHEGGRVQPMILEDAPCGEEMYLIRTRIFERGDRKVILSGGENKQVTVWDHGTQNVIGRSNTHQGTVIDVDLHPTESMMLSSASDGGVLVRALE